MSLTGKTLASTYKSLIRINDDTNGIDTNVENVTDGEGTSSVLGLSTDSCMVVPKTTDKTAVFAVQDKDSNTLFVVDSDNDLVKSGIGQHNVNTQYAHFGISNADAAWDDSLANTHYAVPFGGMGRSRITTIANFGFGTSTDPATTLTISDSAHDILQCYWYVPDNITVDAVQWWQSADAATGDTTRGHLMAYSVVTTAGATSGDLSSGTVVASSSDVTNAGYEQSYYNSMTIDSADVNAGKVMLFMFRADSVNSDYTINATVKYHLR